MAIIWFFTTFTYVQALCALHDFSNGTCHHERLAGYFLRLLRHSQ